VGKDRVAPARANRQRDQEPLEHPHQEDGDRSPHPQAASAYRSSAAADLAGGGTTASTGATATTKAEHGAHRAGGGGGNQHQPARRGTIARPQQVSRVLHRRGAHDPPGRDHGAVVRRPADDVVLRLGVVKLRRGGGAVPGHGRVAGRHVQPDGSGRHDDRHRAVGRVPGAASVSGVRGPLLQRVPAPEWRRRSLRAGGVEQARAVLSYISC
jgi:hypothetical protein